MKVLHVITGLGGGGAESALVQLIRNSADSSKHAVVSLMDGGVHSDTLTALGASVFTLGQVGGRISPNALLALRRLVRDISPDLVQSWMYHADLVATIATAGMRLPLVWGLRRSANSWKELGPSTWFVAKACALLSRLAPSAIISCSRHSMNVHRRFGYADRMIYVPNGFSAVPSSTPELRTAARRSLGLSSDMPVVGHAARFHPVKGHANFLEAIQSVQTGADCLALMAGRGVLSESGPFRRLCDHYPHVRGSYLGALDGLENLYRACDLFVLSSRSEGFPNVVAEAMLHGVPCVVTDVGDAREVVGDSGWVVPPENAPALSAAICAALEQMKDPVVWAERSKRCRERILEIYSVERMSKGFMAVWSIALEQSQCVE